MSTTKITFKEYFAEKLAKVAAEQTANELGDRSKYIGASDIGDCLRKAYLGKVKQMERDVKNLIVLQRGHVAENIIASVLEGLNVESQYEVVGELDGFPLKAHIDFLVIGKTEVIAIECKSVSQPIDEPYTSWILQTQTQMGLLKKYFPDKEVKAIVFAIDLNSGWIEDFPVAYSDELFKAGLKKAGLLIKALNEGVEPEGEEQLYCSVCLYKEGCPALQKGEKKELPEDIKVLVRKSQELAKMDKERKKINKSIEEFLIAANARTGIADKNTVRVFNVNGKKSLNEAALREAYEDIDFDQFVKESDPYSYIRIY